MRNVLVVAIMLLLTGLATLTPSKSSAAEPQTSCQRTCFQSPQCCDQPIRPFIQCQTIDSNGDIELTFGYENPNPLDLVQGVSFSTNICRTNNIMLGLGTIGGFGSQVVRFQTGTNLNAFTFKTLWDNNQTQNMVSWVLDEIRLDFVRDGSKLTSQINQFLRIDGSTCTLEPILPASTVPVCAGSNALSRLLISHSDELSAVEMRTAQLEQRVTVLEARVDSLSQPFGDDDGDGVINQNDSCPETTQGAAVDSRGCSRTQFCGALRLGGKGSAKNSCNKGDWDKDGIPDCMVVDNACVAR